jgi:MFS family permease
LAFTLLNCFVGLPSTVVAAAILKWSLSTTFVLGSTVILLGSLWMSWFATRPWHYLVGFGVFIATGICFGTLVPVTTAVARWFHRYRGRAMAVPLGASGVAGFVGAPLFNQFLTWNGGNWRQAWQLVAGLIVVSAIVAVLFVKERPEDFGQTPDGDAPGSARTQQTSGARVTRFPWTATQVYRTASYWRIVIGGIACQFPFFFFTAHWILHLRQHGISAPTPLGPWACSPWGESLAAWLVAASWTSSARAAPS